MFGGASLKTIGKLETDREFIALIGSGLSILDMPDEEFHELKRHAYIIHTNYAFCRFGPAEMDMLVWYDQKVSRWIESHLKEGVSLWTNQASLMAGVAPKLAQRVDYWLESGRGSFTLLQALINLQKFLPNKKVLLFGVDMKANPDDAANVKWYDHYMEYDKASRNHALYPAERAFKSFGKEFRIFVQPHNIVNCNLDSGLDHFPKMIWQEAVKSKE